MKSEFGWTVVRQGGTDNVVVYKRDYPADAAHFAADLAPFTHPTKVAAVAAGKRGEFAYKR
jgi:hypothetical protein